MEYTKTRRNWCIFLCLVVWRFALRTVNDVCILWNRHCRHYYCFCTRCWQRFKSFDVRLFGNNKLNVVCVLISFHSRRWENTLSFLVPRLLSDRKCVFVVAIIDFYKTASLFRIVHGRQCQQRRGQEWCKQMAKSDSNYLLNRGKMEVLMMMMTLALYCVTSKRISTARVDRQITYQCWHAIPYRHTAYTHAYTHACNHAHNFGWSFFHSFSFPLGALAQAIISPKIIPRILCLPRSYCCFVIRFYFIHIVTEFLEISQNAQCAGTSSEIICALVRRLNAKRKRKTKYLRHNCRMCVIRFIYFLNFVFLRW